MAKSASKHNNKKEGHIDVNLFYKKKDVDIHTFSLVCE